MPQTPMWSSGSSASRRTDSSILSGVQMSSLS
jgi:hypothetical protein